LVCEFNHYLRSFIMRNYIKQFGQGMTEYIIIVALIAIAAIAVYGFFGDTIRGQMGQISTELAGGTGTAGQAAATATAGKAVAEAAASKGTLSGYTGQSARQ
jgi:type IV pilus assembly protein PilA